LVYLLDANVLIDANRDYYPIGRVDEFWEWLVYQGEQGHAKIPQEIYEEIKEGKSEKDELALWAKNEQTEHALKLGEEVKIDFVRKVTEEGYAQDLSDIEVEEIGRDPFLIAYALVNPSERFVVTTEVSKPKRKRANRHVPDVCDQLGIQHCNTYEFLKAMDFRTNWRSSLE